MTKKIILLLIFILILSINIFPCTTGLVDKNFASNKRSILWKNRDSSHQKNEIVFFDYGEIKFIGLINNNDTTQVWSGVNNFGFAIMNAESRDMVVENGDSTQYDDEGFLMKEALQKCKNIKDFENFLKLSNISGRKVTSNFGVIDASGNAAYFETGNHKFFKHNANNNYLIRANFSFNGRGDEKYGLFRYHMADMWFDKLSKQNNLTPSSIINNIITDVYLPPTITKSNFHQYKKIKLYDTICRYSTVAATVVEGVQKGENPEMTTFWCNLGHTASSVSIPLWVYSESIPKSMEGEKESKLNKVFRDIRKVIGNGDKKYISPGKYIEVRKYLDKLQKSINKQTAKQLKKWRKETPTKIEVSNFQNKITNKVLIRVREVLELVR